MTTPLPPDFLTTVLSDLTSSRHGGERPYVTLTFAQSLDAKIAGVGRKQLILSGQESMIMTHWFTIQSLRVEYNMLTRSISKDQDADDARRHPRRHWHSA